MVQMIHSHTDEQLVELVRKGDTQLFSELYTRYVDAIYRFALISVRHKETAEDVTSAVFIKALNRIDTFRQSTGSFKSWLYGIARNALIDHHRSSGHELAVDEMPELPFHQGIERGADIARTLKKIDEELKGIDEDIRQILVLRLWDDLPFSEIAKLVGKSESAVKMTFYRTIETLRASLLVLLVALADHGSVIIRHG